MKIHRIDHISINVNDLPAAKAFFLDLGLEVQMEFLDAKTYDKGLVLLRYKLRS